MCALQAHIYYIYKHMKNIFLFLIFFLYLILYNYLYTSQKNKNTMDYKINLKNEITNYDFIIGNWININSIDYGELNIYFDNKQKILKYSWKFNTIPKWWNDKKEGTLKIFDNKYLIFSPLNKKEKYIFEYKYTKDESGRTLKFKIVDKSDILYIFNIFDYND